MKGNLKWLTNTHRNMHKCVRRIRHKRARYSICLWPFIFILFRLFLFAHLLRIADLSSVNAIALHLNIYKYKNRCVLFIFPFHFMPRTHEYLCVCVREWRVSAMWFCISASWVSELCVFFYRVLEQLERKSYSVSFSNAISWPKSFIFRVSTTKIYCSFDQKRRVNIKT